MATRVIIFYFWLTEAKPRMVTTHATFLGCFYSPSPHLICATAPHAGWRLTTKGPVRIVPERGCYWQSLCDQTRHFNFSQVLVF